MTTKQMIQYVLLLSLAACGGFIEAKHDDGGAPVSDSSTDSVSDSSTDSVSDSSTDSVASMACPSGADRCIAGVYYVCDGNTQTLHAAPGAGSCAQPDACIPAKQNCFDAQACGWTCAGVGWFDTCTNTLAPDADSCFHCGMFCTSQHDL